MSTSNTETPSAWVVRHLGLLKPGGRVLDLACGNGRHSRLLLEHGFRVTAVDRDVSGLDSLREQAELTIRELDLETTDWPLDGEQYDGIIVTNYLFRPHLGRLAANLAPAGALIYATFAVGHEKFGRPRNPDFLLQHDELLSVFEPRLQIVAFEQDDARTPPAPTRQRLCAVNAGQPAATS